MKAPARARRKAPRGKCRVPPQSVSIYRAHKEVREPQGTCGIAGKAVQIYIAVQTFPSGPPGWDEESGLLDDSAQFSPTGCSQTGELGGFQAVKEQQSKSDHSGGDPCCCCTGAEENTKQNCCMKSWPLVYLILFNVSLKTYFKILFLAFPSFFRTRGDAAEVLGDHAAGWFLFLLKCQQ